MVWLRNGPAASSAIAAPASIAAVIAGPAISAWRSILQTSRFIARSLEQLSAGVLAEIVPQPEGFVPIAVTVELTPGIAFDIAGLLVVAEQIDRPVAIGPDVKGAGLARLRAVAGFG